MVHDYALLLVIAFTGTINPSAGSVSVFVPLEHAALSAAVRDSDRTKLFARYSLVGAFAAAFGALAAAAPDVVELLGVDQLTLRKDALLAGTSTAPPDSTKSRQASGPPR